MTGLDKTSEAQFKNVKKKTKNKNKKKLQISIIFSTAQLKICDTNPTLK